MAQLTSSLVVRLIDQVTVPAKKVGASLLGLNKVAGGTFGQRLAGAIEANNAALDRTRGRVAAAAGTFYVLARAISSPVSAAADFENAMADVRKVVDFPAPDGFEKFKADLLALSKQVPLSVNGLAQIAAAAGQAGIASGDLVKFTEAAAKVGVAFDISADETGDALAKLMTGLGLDIDQVVSLADAMNYLSNQQASSAADILDVVRRVGAQAKLYGFTAEQTAAFASAMLSAGAESEVAATSFRNMGLALTRGASATKKQRDAFKKLGLDARTVAKDMQKDAVGTVIDVLERLSKLPKDQQGAIASNLFGNEARALGPLLTNLDLVKKSIGMVSDETDYAGSSMKEYEVRAKTFSNKMALFKNRLTALGIVIGNALIPALSSLMEKITPIIEKVTAFAEAHPELTRNVLAATAALIAFKAATTALTFVGLLGRGGALSLLALGFNTVGRAAMFAKRGAGGMIALQSALAGMQGLKLTGAETFFAGLRGIVVAVPGITAIGEALTVIGGAAASISAPAWGLIAAAVLAVAGAGLLLWKYWDRVSSTFTGVAKRLAEELQPAIEAARPIMQPFADLGQKVGAAFDIASKKIGEFIGWLGQFFQREIGTDEQKASWEKAGYDWADAMISSVKSGIAGLIDYFKGLGGEILAAIGIVDLSKIIAIPDIVGMIKAQFGLGGPGPSSNPSATINGRVDPGLPVPSAHRAGGGPVWPGGSFLVGDGGEPEIFTPKAAGTITPASKIGGGPVTIGPFHISGGSDPEETARAVAREVEKAVDDLLRGAHSDSEAWYQ